MTLQRPAIDGLAGGVTISEAIQTTVISFAALRRLRFKRISREAGVAARTAVAALGVAAISYQHELDFDLRSRCLLLPAHGPRIELLKRDGSSAEVVRVTRKCVAEMLAESAAHASDLGIPWAEEAVRLQPAPKLLELIRRSRKVSVAESAGG